MELLARAPCAVSCLQFTPRSARPRTARSGPAAVEVRKSGNVAIVLQPRTTTRVRDIDARLFEWRARRAKEPAGANVHIVNGEWRQPQHPGGPCTIHPAGREVTARVFARKVVSFTSRVCK